MSTHGKATRFVPYREVAIWAAIAGYLALVLLFAWNPTPFAQVLAAIGCASALIHCVLTYGFKNTTILVVICLAVTFTIENIGVSTGLIFGNYHFEVGASLPHIGAVPIIVGGLWFGMGYFAWNVASTILGGADRKVREDFNVVVLPIIASLVMTQWDYVMDAPIATISRVWIWRDGGADFGVPLSNYFGWLLTSWLFYQGFAVYLATRQQVPYPDNERALRFIAILFFAFSGLTHLTPWLLGQAGEVADATGHIWSIGDMREAKVGAMLLTIFFTSLLAMCRLVRSA